MAMIRPEVLQKLSDGREILSALALALLGVWLGSAGGYVLGPLGIGIAALAAAWAVQAWRRLRFLASGDAPGLVEVDEGQVSYFGPLAGGAIGLPDLIEIRLITLRGRRVWRLKQSDGQALLIPVEAAGTERLFDAFASLPGMDTSVLVGALQPRAPGHATALAPREEARLIWQRKGQGLVRR